MKKYGQVALVILVLAILVFVRRMKSDETQVLLPTPPSVVSTAPTSLPTTEPTTQPTTLPTASPTPTATTQSQYKDGTFTGSVEDAFYGNFQVAAVISGGKLTDVQFLQYPNDRGTSIQINAYAMPILRSEALQAQSAQVDTVSSASQSSGAFVKSLDNALQQARRG